MIGVLGSVVAIAIVWAILSVFAPSDQTPHKSKQAFATAASGSVSESIPARATPSWSTLTTARNQLEGIVTSVADFDGAKFTQGCELYRVDLRPVVAVQGDVPAFRTIERGVSGPDVKQFQIMLRDSAFYFGPIDGTFETLTEAATRKWQHSLEIDETGVVLFGDVIFLSGDPKLLASTGDDIETGNSVVGGEPAVSVVAPSPSFAVTLNSAQVVAVKKGTQAVIHGDGHDWSALTTTPRSQNDDTFVVNLQGKDGAAICGAYCDTVPRASDAQLQAELLIVPKTSGVVIPAAAMRTTKNGEIRVHTSSGKDRSVTVLASAKGQSVVSGITVGTRVAIYGIDRD